ATSVGGLSGRAGTICCVVRDRGGTFYLLSDTHIIADPSKEGAPILQPSVVDGGDPKRDEVARLARWVPVLFDAPNKTSGALARLLPDVRWCPQVLALGKIKGIAEARPGQQVQIIGRTSPLTTGRVVGIDSNVKITYPKPGGEGQRQATFTRLIRIKG